MQEKANQVPESYQPLELVESLAFEESISSLSSGPDSGGLFTMRMWSFMKDFDVVFFWGSLKEITVCTMAFVQTSS